MLAQLGPLVENFDRDPQTAGRLMRELELLDPASFLQAATRMLRNVSETRGFRYLIALLAGHDLLARCLINPTIKLRDAVVLARIGMQMDPMLDTRLSHALFDTAASLNDEEAARLLHVLGEASDGGRLLPLLTRLLQHPGERVRSKAALLIGRRNQSTRWLERRQEETDPRVRANAIEGLWGVELEGCGRVLWEAAQDNNNRVAGNALVGLYRLGDTAAIGKLVEMTAHAKPRFRSTAAWAMGETGDPRFLPVLGPMLGDGDAKVRSRVFQTIGKIKKRTADMMQAGSLDVYVWLGRPGADGSNVLRVNTRHADGRPGPANLAPTDFVVWEGESALTSYSVECRKPVVMSVGFALPRGAEPGIAENALLGLLRWKRSADQWAVLRYAAQSNAVETVRFYNAAPMLGELLERPALRPETAGGLAGAAQRLLAAPSPVRSERHLVLLRCGGADVLAREAAPQLALAALEHGISIHAVVTDEADRALLEDLCSRTGGRFLCATEPRCIADLLTKLYWGLNYQYRVTYPTQTGSTAVKVQVWSSEGFGETTEP